MVSGNVFGNGISPTGLVDKMIGDAFPVVRHVANNMPYIKHVSENLESIYRVWESVDNIDLISTHANNIDTVAGHIINVGVVGQNISAINNNAQNIANINNVGNSIANVIAVSGILSAVSTVAANVATIQLAEEFLNAAETDADVARSWALDAQASSVNALSNKNAAQISADNAAYYASQATEAATGQVYASDAQAIDLAAVGKLMDPRRTALAVQNLMGLSIDAYPTIEAAITAASLLGRGLRGSPGKTYRFTTGVTITGGLDLDVSGCKIELANTMPNVPAIIIDHPLSANTYAACDDVVSFTIVEYNFGNGASAVPRIEVASTAGYAVGQKVKVLSSDKIPSVAGPSAGDWQNMRHAEIGEIGAISGNYLYLIRPFLETWTATKIVRMTDIPVRITGGEWYNQAGYPTSRNAAVIELRNCVRPRYEFIHMRDTASMQVFTVSCYEALSRNNRFDRPRHLPANSAYGYGEKVTCSTRPVQMNAVGQGCRHVFDTGAPDILDANLATTHPRLFGGVMGAHVKNGHGIDSINAPFCDHPDACGTVFEGCSSSESNRRSPGATLWAMEVRGRNCRVKGGVFSSLAPLYIQASTSAPTIVEQSSFSKIPASDTSVNLEPLINIDGSGVIGGGRAEVKLVGIRAEQFRGRKELIYCKNANLALDGTFKIDTNLGQTPVIALENSNLTILGMVADFSKATANQPMLISLRSSGCVVRAPGRIIIQGPEYTADAAIVFVSYAFTGTDTPWEADIIMSDIIVDNTIFSSGSGLRFPPATLNAAIVARRMDNLVRRNDIAVNFSSGAGAKPISWPSGLGEAEINVAVTPTTTGTFVGTIPAGTFVGQKLILRNVAASFSFEVQTTGNIAVAATRVVSAGGSIILRWSGTAWTA